MPTTATPLLLRDPGYLFWAPVGTALPTNTATASKFSDAWPVAWKSLGATTDGAEFSWTSPQEPVYAAEFLNPLTYVPGEQAGRFTFALLDYTFENLKRAMNGGTITSVPGATPPGTEVNTFDPPDPADLVRSMIGWESLDSTVRFVGRQCINGGEITSGFKKGTDVATIPCEFTFERPATAKSWSFFGTSTRKGV